MVEQTEEYYFPDIIEEVVTRVNDYFANLSENPFTIDFNKGIYQQVGVDRSRGNSADFGDIFFWLVMPFEELDAKHLGYQSDVGWKLLIASKTEANYTQEQRQDINFIPKLIPAYNRFIEELKDEDKLCLPEKIIHTYKLLPYWGGGDVSAPGQPNIWGECYDVVELSNIRSRKQILRLTPLFLNNL